MFTLSNKTRVLNTAAHVRVFSNANVERVTAASIAATDRLQIEGFLTCDLSNITYVKMRRARVAVQDTKDWAIVAPAGLAVGDSIEVILSLKTTRYQAEVLTQQYIGQGRTLKFQTAPLTAVTAAAIDTAITAGFQAFVDLFVHGTPIVSVTTGTTPADGTIRTLGDLAGSVSVVRVELKRINTGIATQVPVSLVSTVVSDAFEGQGLGKFLEESISMATPMNVDPYGIDSADTRVDIRGSYTEIIFSVNAPYMENLATNAADYGAADGVVGPAGSGVPANHSFSLYLNEATCLAADSAIAKLAAIAILRAAALPTVITATVQAAPLTAAQERTEALIIANNSSVATVAAFIA